jgi:CheY-like chemotaxis protein
VKVDTFPPVSLTAYANREDKVRLPSGGFQAHVPKPLEAHELSTVIPALASYHRARTIGKV